MDENIEALPKEVGSKPYKNLSKTILVIFLFLLFFAAGGLSVYAALLLYSSQKTNNFEANQQTINNKIVITPTQAPTQISNNDKFLNKVFYVFENNIFSYDTNLKITDQLTDFDLNSKENSTYDDEGNRLGTSVNVNEIFVIDSDTIGFSMFNTKTGDYGCSLNTLNLVNKNITNVKKFNKDELLIQSNFYSPTKYAYLIENEKFRKLILVDNGSEVVLESLEAGRAYGRGGSENDSSYLKFSTDGNYLLQISTSSPKSVVDYKVYIYNLITGNTQIINNATHPAWLDNKSIVYKKVLNNSEGDGLYTYNLQTTLSEKIADIDKNAYDPKVLLNKNKILYTNYPNKQIWLYDFKTKTNTKILDNAIYGNWLNEDLIVYKNINICKPSDDCYGPVDYNFLGINIYSLNTNSVVHSLPKGVWTSTSY